MSGTASASEFAKLTGSATLTVTDAAWKPRPELSGNARWTADGPVTAATLQLDTDGGGSQPFLITGADVRASWDRQGVADCEAAYRITGWVTRLGVILPVDGGYSIGFSGMGAENPGLTTKSEQA